ncbi:MAG: polyamine aminopropyltransferase [Elusimicrobia bacterium]|nr:polyamine aminopropyltransferase [Elusimicrobiota bacterium]
MTAPRPGRRPKAARWVDEVYQGVIRTGFRLERRLFLGRSPHQRVEVVETAGHGRLLLIDGMTMVSERDEFVYHEMIAHVPLCVHPRPRRVLVVGGGDGGTVREVLRHPSVESCTLVEIDGLVVDASRRYLPRIARALAGPRSRVLIEDGVSFVRRTAERFDVVIVDSTEPCGPAKELFGPAFYRDVRRVLADDGIVVSQAGSPFYELGTIKNLLGILRPVFPVAQPYLFTNLTYPGGLWAFTYASRGLRPVADLKHGRSRGLKGLSWYSPAVHAAAFVLPAFMERALGRRSS